MNRLLLLFSTLAILANGQYFNSWQSIRSVTDLNGVVYALLLNPINGDLFIGGNFTSSTQTGAVGRFFGITNNRTTIQAFGTGLNGNVNALCFGATYETVYVGGDFTTANGVSATSIVELNTTNGQWTALSGNYGGVANALVFSPTRNILVAGGSFINDVPCSAMIWNGTWQASANSLMAINALTLIVGDIIVAAGEPSLFILDDQGNGDWTQSQLSASGEVYSATYNPVTGRVLVGTSDSVIAARSGGPIDFKSSISARSMVFSNDSYLRALIIGGDNSSAIFACDVNDCSGPSQLSSAWFSGGKSIYSMVVDSNSHDLIVGGQFNSIGNVPTSNLAILSLVPPALDDRHVCVIATADTYPHLISNLNSSVSFGFSSSSFIQMKSIPKLSDLQNCKAVILANDGTFNYGNNLTSFGNALWTRVQQGMGVVVTQTCLRTDLPCFGNSPFVNNSLCVNLGSFGYFEPFKFLVPTSPLFDGNEILYSDITAAVDYIPRSDSTHLASFSISTRAASCVRKIPNSFGENTNILVLNIHPESDYIKAGSLDTIVVNSLKYVVQPTPTRIRPCSSYQCSNGTCVSDLGDCYSPPSMEFVCQSTFKQNYCSQTLNCETSLSVCAAASSSSCASYQCWNGVCETNSSRCAILPSCPALKYRCWDGSCSASLNTCPTVTDCTLISKPYRCPDGVCAANVSQCAPFDGCTVGMVLCASGLCAQNSSSCYSTDTAQVICQDGTTASSISGCVPFVGVYDSPSISKYFALNSSVYFALSSNNLNQGKMIVALNASSGTFQSTNASCGVTISMSILANSVFSLDNLNSTNATIYNPNSFGIEISIPSCVQVMKHVQISFRVSSNFNILHKCLAYFNSSQNKWTCESSLNLTRILTETGFDYYATGLTSHFSSFALLGEDIPTTTAPDRRTDPPIPIFRTSENSNSGLIIGIIVAVVVVCIVILIIAIVLITRRRKTNKSPSRKAADHENILMTVMDEPRALGKEDIKKGEKIGGGRFGSVFKGDYKNNQVALKELSDANLSAFELEASALRKLRHPNIVCYFGIWIDAREEKYIVSEFVSGGSLQDLLTHENSLTQTNFISLSLDIANGMSYLHSQKILHRDLACKNVLVSKENDKWIAKVSDFGLKISEKVTDAVRWTAPEALTDSKFSFASDVFSFSITMYEIFSRGLLPYSNLKTSEVVEKVPKGFRMNRVVNSEITIPEKLFELIERCWAQEPISRPIFEEICKVLTSFKENPNSIHDKAKNNQNELGKEFMLDSGDIVKGKSIGSGQFGQVYLGTWASQKVALKTLSSDQDSKTAFIQEIKLAIQLHSPAVVNTFGAVEMGGSLYVVMEFCEKGSLLDWLKSKDGSAAQQPILIKMALQTTRALVILEKRSIIHRDIAARNFLLTGDLSVKLADFGLARWSAKGDLYNAKSEVMIPIRWAAPEIILRNQYSAASDRFALGVTLWEIFSRGATPHVGLNNNEICKRWETKSMDRLRELEIPEIDKVISKLCSFDAEDRPTLDFVENFFSSQLPENQVAKESKDDHSEPDNYQFSPLSINNS